VYGQSAVIRQHDTLLKEYAGCQSLDFLYVSFETWRKIIESWIDGEYDKNKGNTVHKCTKLEKLYFGILANKDQTHNIEKIL
jgi:hypothetical protein